MKPAPFEYHAPESLDDVLAVLAEHGDEAKPLAGGQSLVPMLAMRLTRFEHLVDLNRVASLSGISRSNGTLTVGATTRQVQLERDPATAAVPLLGLAAPLIGHFQIRNRGTVGGSIAHADPAAELPAVALALDATLDIAGPSGLRTVPAAEFFTGTWETAIEDGDVLSAIHFPVWSGATGFAVDEVARRHGDFALTGAVCAIGLGADGTIDRAAIALFGMDSTPVRAADAEAALLGRRPADVDVADAGRLAVQGLDPPADIHASSAYRTSVGAHVVQRGLGRALQEAQDAG